MNLQQPNANDVSQTTNRSRSVVPMSGLCSRNFRVTTISRHDLMALTEEAAKISGIPYVMDAYREEAERIIEG